MPIAYLAEKTPLTIEQANGLFSAVDTALRVLFNGQSPLLYLSFNDGAGLWERSGLAGLLIVLGDQGERKILSAVASHDQDAFDTAAAGATLGAQDDGLKQVTLSSLASGALSKSLVIQKRTVTPPVGPDEPYCARVAYSGADNFHHEKRHELAAVDVVFEGYADRTFEWPTAWDKAQCVRFHNLDSNATPLVVTFEETAETLTLERWECKTMRRVDNGTGITWQEDGFLLWQMRAEDLDRLGNSFPWNDRVGAGAEVWNSIWHADGGNNVASWASLYRVLDFFAATGMPKEIWDNDGVEDSYDQRTGIIFDLSDITRNAGTLRPFPDPTDDDTPIYKLAWHGGKFFAVSKSDGGSWTLSTATASIDQLLSGSGALNVKLVVDSGGATAHLKVITGTDVELVDLVPVGSNLGASGHPFTIPDDGTGYNVPPAIGATWDGINRLAGATETETVYGIGFTATTDYVKLSIENSNATFAEPLQWTPFEGTIADVKGWTFHDGTKNNSHGTFYSNSAKWDGRRLAVNALLRIVPAAGACLDEDAAFVFANNPAIWPTFGYAEWYQFAEVQKWPVSGGPWNTPNYVRRSKAPIDPDLPIANPNAQQYLGTNEGEDFRMKDSREFPRSKGIKRQLPINDITGTGLQATAPELTGAYFVAEDSTQEIVDNIGTTGWWETHRAAAIAGTAIGTEVRPVVAPVLRARHFNVLAQRVLAIKGACPFTFFDAIYYGREFRPGYAADGQAGIFDGQVYPFGFIRYSTGATATRAADLGLTVRDFATEFVAYASFSAIDVDLVDSDGFVDRAFDVAGGTPFDAWNMDLPYWCNPYPDPALERNESVAIQETSPGTGWVEGEVVLSVDGHDYKAWYLPNDAAYAMPDFEYIRSDDLATLAADLGIPFRFYRLSFELAPLQFTPDRQAGGVRQVPGLDVSVLRTRTEVRLVPTTGQADLVMFAGTGDTFTGYGSRWGASGLVRVADWPEFPSTQGSDNATVRMSIADLMHGYDRSGSGHFPEFPYGFYPAAGAAPSPEWRNEDAFEGEAVALTQEVFDTIPTPPTGWAATQARLGTYPVPAIQWGATDLEENPAPDVDPCWIRLSDLPTQFAASDIWTAANGSGAWDGKGGFAVHLFQPIVEAL